MTTINEIRVQFYSKEVDKYGHILDELRQEIKVVQEEFDRCKALLADACKAKEAEKKN